MFFEYLLNSLDNDIFNEDTIVIGDGKSKQRYRIVPPGKGKADNKEPHVDSRIKYSHGSDKSEMSIAVDRKHHTVNFEDSKIGNTKHNSVDDFRNVIFYTSAIMAYDSEKFDSLRTDPNNIKETVKLMEEFNDLPKSERDKYYKQGKENFNKYNKNVKWPR